MQEIQAHVEFLKFIVSVATLLVGIVGGIVALTSFRRTEKWKKAEFLADEMKEFFADERVQKTLLFIDWGNRRIQILPESAADQGMVIVDRLLQARALRPHTVPSNLIPDGETVPNSDVANSDALSRFRAPEVAIRDCYDGFLDGLAKFASYAQTSLVEVKALDTYIRYWLNSIQEPAEGPKEAAWKASLLTYISFYEYRRVIWLFEQYGYDIKPSSATYRQFLSKMENRAFASALAESVGFRYPSDVTKALST